MENIANGIRKIKKCVVTHGTQTERELAGMKKKPVIANTARSPKSRSPSSPENL
jgi:hypothetical protein